LRREDVPEGERGKKSILDSCSKKNRIGGGGEQTKGEEGVAGFGEKTKEPRQGRRKEVVEGDVS